MGAFLMTALVCFFNGFNCFENLSKRNTTVLKLSSTLDGFGVTLANDGNLDLKDRNCSHTDLYQPQAWLQVDLGQSYSLCNVKIYYRTEDSWKPYRFRHFYLDVSGFPATTSNTSQRTRCYTDNTTHPNIPPNIIDIPCIKTARYVIVETTYDAPEDDYYGEIGPILEICEIEIYGCETGKYGEDCRPCVGCQSCDIKSGRCDTCSININCTNGCKPDNGDCYGCVEGMFGGRCNETCSSGCVSGCDQITGHCTCKEVWHKDSRVFPNLQYASSQHLFYAVFLLFGISLVVNIFLSRRWMKHTICKCEREQSRQNEKRGRASKNEDAAEMKTDYQNLSELFLSQHHYEQVGYI